MSVAIKTDAEIDRMRVAGRLAAEVLEMIGPHVLPGVTTAELDERCHDFIVNVQGAVPAPLNYRGFPRSICTSVNNQVCHGIPGHKRLKAGDVVNIDITVIKDGYHGDTSKMFFIGEPSVLARRLARVTREAMLLGIAQVRPGASLGDIGHAIQSHAESHRYSVVREYCGHGIGREFHEEPQVLHYGNRGEGLVLQAGMCFTIEPMINAGKRFVKLLPDGWTVVTKDRSLSAQWEHTVLVTETGAEILTLRAEERDELAAYAPVRPGVASTAPASITAPGPAPGPAPRPAPGAAPGPAPGPAPDPAPDAAPDTAPAPVRLPVAATGAA